MTGDHKKDIDQSRRPQWLPWTLPGVSIVTFMLSVWLRVAFSVPFHIIPNSPSKVIPHAVLARANTHNSAVPYANMSEWSDRIYTRLQKPAKVTEKNLSQSRVVESTF